MSLLFKKINHVTYGFFLIEIVLHRSESPPVPAVKNRLHQGQQKQIHTSNFLVLNNSSRKEKSVNTDTQQRSSPTPVTEPGRPPSSHFIPYVRTNEVYYLDPDAPVTRPSTHEPQYQQFNGIEMYCELILVEEKKCYKCYLVQTATTCSIWYLFLLNSTKTQVWHNTAKKAYAPEL